MLVALLEFVLLEKFETEDFEVGQSLQGPIADCLGNLCTSQLGEIEQELICAKFLPLWIKIFSSESYSTGTKKIPFNVVILLF